jgi:hypothetical protein
MPADIQGASVYTRIYAKDELTPQLKNTKGAINEFGGGLKDAVLGMVGFASAAAAGAAVVANLRQALIAAAEEESSLVSLGATIKSMGKSGEISADGIRQMTEAMQAANGVFSHDDLEKAAQSFLRIENFDPSNLQNALKVVQDFAAGTGSSAADAAQGIATALETGQTRSLRFSLALRTQIQEMIKAGDSAGALALIMQTLNDKYGGQATAQMDTYNGKTKILKNSWDEFLATVGGEGLPAGKGILDYLNKATISATQLISIGQQLDWNKLGGMGLGEGLTAIALAGPIKQFELIYTAVSQIIDPVETVEQKTDRLNKRIEVCSIQLEKMKGTVYEGGSAWRGYQVDLVNTQSELARLTNVGRTSAQQLADASGENALNIAREKDAMYWFAEEIVDTSGKMDAMYSAVTSYGQAWQTSDDAIKAKEEELALAREQGYGEWGNHIQGIKSDLADLQSAQDQQTAQWMLNIMTQQMSVDGLSDTEMQFLLDYQVQTGLLSEEGRQRAMDAWTSANAIVAAVDSIPKSKTVDVFFITHGYENTGGSTRGTDYVERAGGGDVNPGSSYRVGEQGEEGLVWMGSGWRVVPHGEWMSIRNGTQEGMLTGGIISDTDTRIRAKRSDPSLNFYGPPLPALGPENNWWGAGNNGNSSRNPPSSGSSSTKSVVQQSIVAATQAAIEVTKNATAPISQAAVSISASGQESATSAKIQTSVIQSGNATVSAQLAKIEALLQRNLAEMPKQWAAAQQRQA